MEQTSNPTENKNNEENDSHQSLTTEQQMVLSEFNIPENVDVLIEDIASPLKETAIMNKFFQMRQTIYENVLSPQLEENEKLKRQHKSILMNNLFKILKYQFVGTYVFVSILLVGFLFSYCLNLSDELVLGIIDFIKFYITSIIVELITILFFIVKNVFDKSIVELIKNFDKQLYHDNSNKQKNAT